MDNDNIERQLDTHDVHEKIAAIEAKSDMLARKNETPPEVAATQKAAEDYQAKQLREKNRILVKKRWRNIKLNKRALLTIGAAFTFVVIAWFVPPSRYAMLNTLGARSDIKVSSAQASVDGNTVQSQIKNFKVSLNGQVYSSGDATEITIPRQKFGSHALEVSKSGYATQTYVKTVDFDPLFGLMGEKAATPVLAKLVAEGLPVSFTVKDWTSRSAISEGSFTYGDVTAQPDASGKVTLIVPPTVGEKVSVKAEFPKAYIGKSFEALVDVPDQEVTFVPAAKHFFVSKRSGVYSVYSQYLDGSDLKELVKGTNQETSSLQFAISPGGKYGVMTSTREGRRDGNGDLIQKLYWVDLSSGKLEEVDSARDINLHDWSGDIITYSYWYQTETLEYRQRLRSFDTLTQNRYDLNTSSGSFGRVHTSLGMVLFTKQESYGQPGYEKGTTVHMVNVNGKDGRELATNTGELRQLGFDTFAYETTDKKWNEISINTGRIKSTEPPREQGAIYISTESSNKERVFVNFVDGKRILMLQTGGEEKELVSQPGLTGPIRFLNATTILYRVATSSETADYAVSTTGGEPRKVTDVTASSYATPVFFQYY